MHLVNGSARCTSYTSCVCGVCVVCLLLTSQRPHEEEVAAAAAAAEDPMLKNTQPHGHLMGNNVKSTLTGYMRLMRNANFKIYYIYYV